MVTEVRNAIQALADATGFVIDRTLSSEKEKVIGQAWLISKSRVVLPASVVSNYAESPWALMVYFPHPNLTFCVKAVGLHPDFDKRAARNHYLSASQNVDVQPALFENDIATITLEPEMIEMAPDRIAELHRALALPLDITPQDVSGVIRDRETVQVLQNVLQSQRTGTLSFCDERFVPHCRLLIRQGRIVKAMFGETQNELAVCELLWRRPNGNFFMQTTSSLNWGSVPDMGTPTDGLMAEASRRASELPRIIDVLGGPNARYARAVQEFDFSQVNPAQKWVAERLWACLDGYMPIGRLSERIAADSYTILKLLWDLRNANAVQATSADIFHQNGQLGQPLTPAGDVDLAMWEGLHGFYIDPISAAPVLLEGAFAGTARLQSQNSLLHTIPIGNASHGAAIIKEGRLVGVHNATMQPKAGEPMPPVRVSQMTWIGALSELGIKRLRNSAEGGGIVEPSEGLSFERSTTAEIQSRKAGSARARGVESTFDEDDRPEIALESGPEFLQRFSKVQILGVGVVTFMLGFAMMIFGFITASHHPPDQTAKGGGTTTTTTTGTQTATGTTTTTDQPDTEAARKLAIETGFPTKLPEGFTYVDTRKLTEPKPSFGIKSERAHQNWLVVPWPDDTPTKRLDAFRGKVPFYNYTPAGDLNQLGFPHVDSDTGQVWLARDFKVPPGPEGGQPKVEKVALVGAYNPKKPGTTVLVIAEPLSKEGNVDYMLTNNLVTQLLAQGAAESGDDDLGSDDGPGGEKEEATPEAIAAYRTKLQGLVQGKFKAPKEKLKKSEFKSALHLMIDDDGMMKKMDFTAPSPKEELNNALQRAVKDNEPLPKPPHTKKGAVDVVITVDGGKISVDEY